MISGIDEEDEIVIEETVGGLEVLLHVNHAGVHHGKIRLSPKGIRFIRDVLYQIRCIEEEHDTGE